MVAIKQKGQVGNSQFKRGKKGKARLGPGPDPRQKAGQNPRWLLRGVGKGHERGRQRSGRGREGRAVSAVLS